MAKLHITRRVPTLNDEGVIESTPVTKIVYTTPFRTGISDEARAKLARLFPRRNNHRRGRK